MYVKHRDTQHPTQPLKDKLVCLIYDCGSGIVSYEPVVGAIAGRDKHSCAKFLCSFCAWLQISAITAATLLILMFCQMIIMHIIHLET